MSRTAVEIQRMRMRPNSSAAFSQSMNCEACRRRKIRCNRARPTCEACLISGRDCVYDATPKKRGPKSDMLEALVRRIDGLEQRFRGRESSQSPETALDSLVTAQKEFSQQSWTTQPPTTVLPKNSTSTLDSQSLLDAYFSRIHGKPHFIVDPNAGERGIPQHQILAMSALAVRFVLPSKGDGSIVQLSSDFANRARHLVDVDEPSLETLQTLLLLSSAFFELGKVKKTLMLFSNAVGQALALGMNRELPSEWPTTTEERELRRTVFWACYVMDQFLVSGSLRQPLLRHDYISLLNPSPWRSPVAFGWAGDGLGLGSNVTTDDCAMRNSATEFLADLVDVVRILALVNQYLATGGVKGDTHFPWHEHSQMSRILHELRVWEISWSNPNANQVDKLAGKKTILRMLSELIYHLCYCLIYRPFLPTNLSEMRGKGEHQSWRKSIIDGCFLHANAISELLGKTDAVPEMELPPFVSYCIATAATIHVHGAWYEEVQQETFSRSASFLLPAMQQLRNMAFYSAPARHQNRVLRTIYACHHDLMTNPLRQEINVPAVFVDDFFDRYLVGSLDLAHLPMTDITTEMNVDSPRIPESSAHSHQRLGMLDDPMLPLSQIQASANVGYSPTAAHQNTSMQHFFPGDRRSSSLQEVHPGYRVTVQPDLQGVQSIKNSQCLQGLQNLHRRTTDAIPIAHQILPTAEHAPMARKASTATGLLESHPQPVPTSKTILPSAAAFQLCYQEEVSKPPEWYLGQPACDPDFENQQMVLDRTATNESEADPFLSGLEAITTEGFQEMSDSDYESLLRMLN